MSKILISFQAFNERYIPADYDHIPEDVESATDLESSGDTFNDDAVSLLQTNIPDSISKYSTNPEVYSEIAGQEVELSESVINTLRSVFGEVDAIKPNRKNIMFRTSEPSGILLGIKQVKNGDVFIKLMTPAIKPSRTFYVIRAEELDELSQFLNEVKNIG